MITSLPHLYEPLEGGSHRRSARQGGRARGGHSTARALFAARRSAAAGTPSAPATS